MTDDVLHMQTRAYPLLHGGCAAVADTVSVPGRGEVPVWEGALGSQAYNVDTTVEVDLTEMVRAAVSLPGTRIEACRARAVAAGSVLLVYALRHDRELTRLDAYALAEFDAEINRALRDADAAVVTEVWYALAAAGVLTDPVHQPGEGQDVFPEGAVPKGEPSAAGGRLPVGRRAVRYNCHFVAAYPPWAPAERVPSLPAGASCLVLLSYTYAWQARPQAPLDDLMRLQEPADIATAQLSLVYSATLGGRRILEELSASQLEPLREEDLRRFLDRVWASYHRLDGYRIDSAQDHRATYFAAREVVGVDQAHGRAGELLGYVDASLQAASSRRARQLDTRLNRLAAGLTVVVSAEFAVEAAGFLMPEPPVAARILVAFGVPLVAVVGLLAVVLPVRRRERQQRSRGWWHSWHSWPTPVPAPRAAGTGDRESGSRSRTPSRNRTPQ